MSGKYRFTKAYTQKEKNNPPQLERIPGKLGIKMGGMKQVEVANRPGYVWVRVRGDLSETIQAYNASVSPVYDLPVLLSRDRANKTRYNVMGKDDGAYQNWGNSVSAYLPRHGSQHSFNPSSVGGDVTWVWGEQFMPFAVLPSGSLGAMSCVVNPGIYYQNDVWHYAGATGTSSFASYKPTGSSARMVLVYLDDNSNPAYELGSFFSASITGSSQVVNYIPKPPKSTSIPLSAVRLVSGTSYLSWDNLYDVRGFLTGAGGGGTTIVTGTALPNFGNNQVVYTSSQAGLTGSSHLKFNTYISDGNPSIFYVSGTVQSRSALLGEITHIPYGGAFDSAAVNIVTDYNTDKFYYPLNVEQYNYSKLDFYYQNGQQGGMSKKLVVNADDSLFSLDVWGFANAYDSYIPYVTDYPYFQRVAGIDVIAQRTFSGTFGRLDTAMVFSVSVSGTLYGKRDIMKLYGDKVTVDGVVNANSANLGDLVGGDFTQVNSDGIRVFGDGKIVSPGVVVGKFDPDDYNNYRNYALSVVTDYNDDTHYFPVYMRQYNDTDISMYYSNGTQVNPVQLNANDILFDLNIYGYGIDYQTLYPDQLPYNPKAANIQVKALRTFSGTAQNVDAAMIFNVAVSGTASGVNDILTLHGDTAFVNGLIQSKSAKLGDVIGGNFTEISSDGSLRLHGTATAWDDMRVAADTTKLGGNKDPGFSVFKTNGAGSRGVFIYWFDSVLEEEVYFSVQFPYAWKQGSTIYPHVHWTPNSTGTSGQQVVWGLEYSWANINEYFHNTSIVYTSGTSVHDNTLNGAKHYISSYPPIDGSGKKLSSMMLCRLFRNVSDPDDDYADDAGLLEFDIHYEIDSFGSESEYTKV